MPRRELVDIHRPDQYFHLAIDQRGFELTVRALGEIRLTITPNHLDGASPVRDALGRQRLEAHSKVDLLVDAPSIRLVGLFAAHKPDLSSDCIFDLAVRFGQLALLLFLNRVDELRRIVELHQLPVAALVAHGELHGQRDIELFITERNGYDGHLAAPLDLIIELLAFLQAKLRRNTAQTGLFRRGLGGFRRRRRLNFRRFQLAGFDVSQSRRFQPAHQGRLDHLNHACPERTTELAPARAVIT
ncbi:hypothetical protein FQZ97_740180 [compost metagenome]